MLYPPPQLPDSRNFSLDGYQGIQIIDLKVLNSGGTVTQWTLNEEPQLECFPGSNWISLDSNSGILSIDMDLWPPYTNWCGSVSASNVSGTDKMFIFLDNYPLPQ